MAGLATEGAVHQPVEQVLLTRTSNKPLARCQPSGRHIDESATTTGGDHHEQAPARPSPPYHGETTGQNHRPHGSA
jgi:hypothetical protein